MHRGSSIGFGTMRLSTDRAREDGRSAGVVRAALDAGIRRLDTAHAYAHSDDDLGHNERLVARVVRAHLAEHPEATPPIIATKGGMARPQGRWEPDGRAATIRRHCEASLRALGQDRIALYFLHAPDPRVPFETTCRALRALLDEGLVAEVGLSNVGLRLLLRAREILPIAAVEIHLGPLDESRSAEEVVRQCLADGSPLFAHSPFGGRAKLSRFRKHPELREVGEALGATPFEVALAWLAGKSPLVVPLPGATRIETVQSVARAQDLVLPEDLARKLDVVFNPIAAMFEPLPLPRVPAGGGDPSDGEVVVLVGFPGAGKTVIAGDWTRSGYTRLSRDERGGRLTGVATELGRLLEGGARHVIVDNTYGRAADRREVLDVAARFGVPVRCVWLTTTLEDAQINAAERWLAHFGTFDVPESEVKTARKRVANLIGPSAQFGYRRAFEAPEPSEGFATIEARDFVRTAREGFDQRAVIVDLDGVLWESRAGARTPKSLADLVVREDRGATLRRYADDGFVILATTWQPEIDYLEGGAAGLDVLAAALSEGLGVPLDVAACPHPAGPPVCWCRKPLPGLGVLFINRHRLDPAACIHVGRDPHDKLFADRLGFRYVDHETFFLS